MKVNWYNLLTLTTLLLILINFAEIKQYIQESSPFAGLKQLPDGQRYLVILGIILVTLKIIQELRRPEL